MSKQIMVAGVVLLAIFVQLSFVPNHILKFDSSQVLYAANKLALNGDFPVYGILNSRRALNPPFFVWLYLVPIMLVKDPSWVLILPALTLHVIALILLYCLGRRHFGLKVGLAAAVLYGFSTRGLYLGHASWAQAFLSPLYVLVMFSLFQWLQEGKARHLALLLPLAAWTTGVHWGGALTLGVLLLLPLLCSSPRFQTSPILAGGLIALALWIPYLRDLCPSQVREMFHAFAMTRKTAETERKAP